MRFPPLPYLGRAALIAVALAVLGFAVTSATGGLGGEPAHAALLLGLGALLGAWLAGIRRTPSAESDTTIHTLFVGNLAFKASEEELRELFAPFGSVRSTRIMRDRKTRRPRGYGFVEMSGNQAHMAIQALDGKEFLGRKLRVKEGNRKDAENEPE